MHKILQSYPVMKFLRPFFEVLAKVALVVALDGLEVLKNCGLKIKKP